MLFKTKICRAFLVWCCCAVVLPLTVQGQQWEKVPVDAHDRFRDIVTYNDTLFVVTEQSGLWYSGDNGLSWKKSTAPESIVFSRNSLVFTGTHCFYNIARLNDNGYLNFIFHSTSATTGAWMESEPIYPNMADLELRFALRLLDIPIFAGVGATFVGYGSIFSSQAQQNVSYEILSNDVGKTWSFTPVDSGATSQILVYTPFLATLKNMMYRSRNRFLESSRDTAKTWQRFGRGDSIIRSTIQNIAPLDSVVLAITTTGTYRLGRDSVWRESNKGIPISNLFCFHAATHRLYTINQNELLSSRDAGMTWQRGTLPRNTTFFKIVATSKGVIGLALDNTIWFSQNDGLSWQIIHQNLVPQPVEQVLSVAGNIVIAAEKAGILTAKDSSRLQFSSIPLANPTIAQTRQLFRYNNDGVASLSFQRPLSTTFPSPIMGQEIYYFPRNRYFTQDYSCCVPNLPVVLGVWCGYRAWMYSSAEFSSFYTGVPTDIKWFTMQGLNTTQQRHSLLLHTPRELIVGTENGVYRSADSGRVWWQTNLLRPAYILATLGTLTFAGTNDGIFRSADSGQTWQASGLPGVTIHQIATLPPNTVLIGSTTGGVFLSQNAGASWQAFTQGLPSTRTFSLTLSDRGIGYAVVRGELFATNRTVVSVREKELSSSPLQISVVPNPTNDRVNCSITLKKTEMIHLSLQTTLGQTIGAVYEGRREAGEHHIEIETSSLAQGMYWLVLNTSHSQTVQKLLIVR